MDRLSEYSQTYLIECFTYNPLTGDLFWKHRPRHHFATERGWKIWTARFPGKLAGGINTQPNGYKSRIVRIADQAYRAHRIIWKLVTGQENHHDIDHKDRDGLNNRWKNLRLCTGDVRNTSNLSRYSNNTSGVIGVSWSAKHKSWMGQIWVNKQRIWVGRFKVKEDAIAAVAAARLGKGFGEGHGQPRPNVAV